MRQLLNLSYLGSVTALGVAACCVLPMTMMLLGLGGSWLAVFGTIASVSYWVLAVSTLLVVASWLTFWRIGSLQHLKGGLVLTTALTALAWVIVFYETRINDVLIAWM